MSRVLPILFNTDMVQAVLDGRKTVTRRIVKGNIVGILNSPYHEEHPEVPDKVLIKKLCKASYQPGDILYIRETWRKHSPGFNNLFIYKADYEEKSMYVKWCPSIHMPKEAARIWLKVTDVRVERLQNMNKMDAVKEGIDTRCCVNLAHALIKFKKLWDSTIKKSDLALYGWDANPWVWVIEFERCEKPES
ncbi:hypothetical protein AALB47_11435 [Lachnospiraceae bacterium 54-11]